MYNYSSRSHIVDNLIIINKNCKRCTYYVLTLTFLQTMTYFTRLICWNYNNNLWCRILILCNVCTYYHIMVDNVATLSIGCLFIVKGAMFNILFLLPTRYTILTCKNKQIKYSFLISSWLFKTNGNLIQINCVTIILIHIRT